MFNEAINNIALSAAAETQAADTAAQTASDLTAKLTEGGYVAIMGIGIVFLVLALIWGVLELFRVFFYVLPNKKASENAADATPAPEKAPAQPASQPAPAAPVQHTDDSLIAAITAAITAYRAAEGNGTYTGGFRVVSFKRK